MRKSNANEVLRSRIVLRLCDDFSSEWYLTVQIDSTVQPRCPEVTGFDLIYQPAMSSVMQLIQDAIDYHLCQSRNVNNLEISLRLEEMVGSLVFFPLI